MNVNCHYCQRPCRLTRPEGRQTDYTQFYQCDYHGAVRVRHYVNNNKLEQVSLVCFYKDTLYQAVFVLAEISMFKFRIDKINPYPRTLETVMTLDQHPDITPENVQSKIATYILFS